jgi:hypothetical protein
MNQVERNVLMYAKLASEIGNLLGSAAKSLHKILPDIAQKAHERVTDCIDLLQSIECLLYDRASEHRNRLMHARYRN